MADHADVADNFIDLFRSDAEAKARGRSAPEFDAAFDGSHCVECEDEIPAPRLALGKVRCVPCQQLRERGVK